MKHFIVNYRNISFEKFKSHGGGDFAVRLVQYIIDSNNSFHIINNSTGLFAEHTLTSTVDFSENELIYFDPMYDGKDDNSFNYKKKYIFIHGLRMLEMPFDKYSYKYYSFPHNILNFFKYHFLSDYYKNTSKKLLNSVKHLKGQVEVLTPSLHSKYIFQSQNDFDFPVDNLPPFLNQREESKEYFIPFSEPYILFLNADRWVKNSYRFLKAFDELAENGKVKGVKLLLVGKPRFFSRFKRQTYFIDYVKREELEWLMKNCLFLAYPSLNEGFGYPPVDCMKYGKPTLCTSVSAPNIVCDGSVLFSSPFSIDELKSRILMMIDSLDSFNNQELQSSYDAVKDEINAKWAQIFS